MAIVEILNITLSLLSLVFGIYLLIVLLPLRHAFARILGLMVFSEIIINAALFFSSMLSIFNITDNMTNTTLLIFTTTLISHVHLILIIRRVL